MDSNFLKKLSTKDNVCALGASLNFKCNVLHSQNLLTSPAEVWKIQVWSRSAFLFFFFLNIFIEV